MQPASRSKPVQKKEDSGDGQNSGPAEGKRHPAIDFRPAKSKGECSHRSCRSLSPFIRRFHPDVEILHPAVRIKLHPGVLRYGRKEDPSFAELINITVSLIPGIHRNQNRSVLRNRKIQMQPAHLLIQPSQPEYHNSRGTVNLRFFPCCRPGEFPCGCIHLPQGNIFADHFHSLHQIFSLFSPCDPERRLTKRHLYQNRRQHQKDGFFSHKAHSASQIRIPFSEGPCGSPSRPFPFYTKRTEDATAKSPA